MLEDCEDADAFIINDKGTLAYYVDDDNEGDLYRIEIQNGKSSTPTKYERNVYAHLTFVGENAICYFKNYDDGEGDLYINKTRVVRDASAQTQKSPDGKTLYYVADESVFAYQNKKSTKVFDDVDELEQFAFSSDGTVVYLDEDEDMYIFQNGKSTRVSRDAVRLLTPSTFEDQYK